MSMDIEIDASGVEIESSGYRGEVTVSLLKVDANSILDELGKENVFEWTDLSEYIDWAESKDKVSEILDRLSPDEVISWLRDNGHLEDEE
ncbi:hypothetical protein OFN39_01590 [Escherichia coli]|nr:hypothetical protein [Escherichia coli]